MSILADMLMERVNPLFNSLQKEIEELKATNNALSEKLHYHVLNSNEKSELASNNVSVTSACSLTYNQSNTHDCNVHLLPPNIVAENTDTLPTSKAIEKSDKSVPSKSNSSATVELAPTKDFAVQSNKLFLCSIERDLTIPDIRFILEDAGITISEVEFIEAKGNFKNKKFIEITSKNRVNLFKFRIAFNQSILKSTWFIRNSPPKSPVIENKQALHQQSSRTHNIHRNISKPTFHHQNSGTYYANSGKRDNRPLNRTNNKTSHKSYAEVVARESTNNTQVPTHCPSNNYIHKDDFQHFLEEVIQKMLIR